MSPAKFESVSRIQFGEVPEGFKQYFPKDLGKKPILESANKYEIVVLKGAHRGRREFEIN